MSASDAREIIEAIRAAHRVAVTCLEEATDKQYALEQVEGMLERIIMLHEIRRKREADMLVDWLTGEASS